MKSACTPCIEGDLSVPVFSNVGAIAEYLGETNATIRIWMANCLLPPPRQKGRPYGMEEIKNLVVYAIATKGFCVSGSIYKKEIATPASEMAYSLGEEIADHTSSFELWIKGYYSYRDHCLSIQDICWMWLKKTSPLSLIQVEATKMFLPEHHQDIAKEFRKYETATSPSGPKN